MDMLEQIQNLRNVLQEFFDTDTEGMTEEELDEIDPDSLYGRVLYEIALADKTLNDNGVQP